MKYIICPKTGILRQEFIEHPKEYNHEYSETRYDRYGELTTYMSYLRLGFLMGTVKGMIGSLCDVGYGNGSFLKVCSNKIPTLVGVDVSGYELPKGIACLKEIPIDYPFDVVCFFDSLEHFSDIEFLRKIKTKYLFISYPECHFYNDMERFMTWKHRRPDEHIYHFNRYSLQSYLMKCGFVCIADSDIEDTIRKPEGTLNNITSLIFRKSI